MTTPTWVLLRGWTRECGHWGDFPATLSGALGGARVVCVDLPGIGRQVAQACPTRVEAMVPPCREALAAEGLQPPWSLLGLSMGGMVAAAWAAAHAGEVAACVLVNSSFGGLSPPWQRLRAGRWLRIPALALAWGRPSIERHILRLTSARSHEHGAALAAWQSLREARPVAAACALRQLLAAARFRRPLHAAADTMRRSAHDAASGRSPGTASAPMAAHAPDVPALVLCSAGDRLVHPACSRAIARDWPARFVEHPWAGHDLPLDDGAWVAGQVAAWQRAGWP